MSRFASRNRVRIGLLAAGIAVSAVPASGAAAATPTPRWAVHTTCPHGTWGGICALVGDDFPGGRISIDVDVTGRATLPGSWGLTSRNGFQCYGTFRMSDPPRSWTCDGVPSGLVILRSGEFGGATTTLGMRW